MESLVVLSYTPLPNQSNKLNDMMRSFVVSILVPKNRRKNSQQPHQPLAAMLKYGSEECNRQLI